MADLDTQDVRSRTLVALFDTREAADRAVRDLEAAGIPRQHITRTENTSSTGSAAPEQGKGLWEELKSLFIPDEDRYAYSEGVRRGGFLVSVAADEANYNRVMDILDNDGAVDLDAREETWRSEGWTGYAAGGGALGSTAAGGDPAAYGSDRASTSSTTTSTSLGGTSALSSGSEANRVGSSVASGTGASTAATSSPGSVTNTTRTTSLGDATTAASAAGASARTLEAGRDEVIPLHEEQLRVGKRDVSHGRVRLRTYVVETPVEEQVGLRQERVSVERRPVDRPVTDATGDVFRERVIEAEERSEEAVVDKDVRVREEIALRKEADERTETVSDSVRRTEVDLQDDRSGRGLGVAGTSTTTSSFAGRIAEHMQVIGSDGQQVGVVDHLEGSDRIKLTKDASPDGQHHFIPLSWVDHVDQHVHLNKSAADAKAGWSA